VSHNNIVNNPTFIFSLHHIMSTITSPTPDALRSRAERIKSILSAVLDDVNDRRIQPIIDLSMKWPELYAFIIKLAHVKPGYKILVVRNTSDDDETYGVMHEIAHLSIPQFDNPLLGEMDEIDEYEEYEADRDTFRAKANNPSMRNTFGMFSEMNTPGDEEVIDVLLSLMIGPSGKIVYGKSPDVVDDNTDDEDSDGVPCRKKTLARLHSRQTMPSTTVKCLSNSITFIVMNGTIIPPSMREHLLPCKLLNEWEYGQYIIEMAEAFRTNKYNIDPRVRHLSTKHILLFYMLFLKSVPLYYDAPLKGLKKEKFDDYYHINLAGLSETDIVPMSRFVPCDMYTDNISIKTVYQNLLDAACEAAKK